MNFLCSLCISHYNIVFAKAFYFSLIIISKYLFSKTSLSLLPFPEVTKIIRSAIHQPNKPQPAD